MMRVVAPSTVPPALSRASRRVRRTAMIETVGLVACSAAVVIGVALTYAARVARLPEASLEGAATINLRRLSGPGELSPALRTFAQPFERERVARALYVRAANGQLPLEHVGGLAGVTIPASEIRGDSRFVELQARLQGRPGLRDVPVLSPADMAAVKPRLIVRELPEYRARVRHAVLWFLGAFWVAHLVRRWRRIEDDPVIIPVLCLLCGVGLIAMLALRDPLRDTVLASRFAGGVVGGLAMLLLASEFDVEASRLRRSMIAPLAAALALAAILLVFGTGPGSSGVKVNLLGFQPVEAIRLLVVFALAAYFARRLELLRELSEPASAGRPWLRYVRVPRWQDVRPVVASMALVLVFFFFQKDLGPALVMSCVFLALYGIARGRAAFVLVGGAMLVCGFAAAYWTGVPATVRQRVQIWDDPWNNAVAGGSQIAHGLWALASGAAWGSGPALGGAKAIPEGHTDFVLAVIGEELGLVGLAMVVLLYAVLCWRCLRAAGRAPGDYSAFLATGLALALVVEALVIGAGVLALIPLSGVVTPFLSYGRSSMLANFFAVGVVLAIARRRGAVREHLHGPIRALGCVLLVAGAAILMRASWIQVIRADQIAAAATLAEQADGGYRYEYNPRLLSLARLIDRGTIYDRNGLPLATSKADDARGLARAYRDAGLTPAPCAGGGARCYPMGGIAHSIIGDWTHQTNWGAQNASYVERDRDAVLKGYDDRAHLVTLMNPRTGRPERAVKRDLTELLPLLRKQHRGAHPSVQALLRRERDVHTSIDARLQVRAAAALRSRVEKGGHERGAAVVLDVETGEVLASVSYPFPTADDLAHGARGVQDRAVRERLFDRARYGLYPPGSTFKLIVAAAALRSEFGDGDGTFGCRRLPDGRVGNYIRGTSRPVRDDPMDTAPHGEVTLRRGLVVSCNAYFAQLALRLGPARLLDAASLFQIDVARPPAAGQLRSTLPHAGYGQGQVLVSPVRMARVAAAVAAEGLVTPVRWTHAPDEAPLPGTRFLSPADAARLASYMREAVTSGTGRVLAGHRVAIAGKTGTAEIAGARAHSWFAGFAPYTGSRQIAFAVVVENAGYGARAAAPIAGEIVTAASELGLVR